MHMRPISVGRIRVQSLYVCVQVGCNPCDCHTPTTRQTVEPSVRGQWRSGDLDFWKPNWKARHLIVGSSSQPDMKT